MTLELLTLKWRTAHSVNNKELKRLTAHRVNNKEVFTAAAAAFRFYQQLSSNAALLNLRCPTCVCSLLPTTRELLTLMTLELLTLMTLW
jgi:hypothetical protein